MGYMKHSGMKSEKASDTNGQFEFMVFWFFGGWVVCPMVLNNITLGLAVWLIVFLALAISSSKKKEEESVEPDTFVYEFVEE